MLVGAKLPWSAKQMYNYVQRGLVSFDNVVQRKLVWDNSKKSLLIHSMLTGYPIPPFYAVKVNDKYDMLDGKQRSNAIIDFYNGEYELINVPETEYVDENGDTVPIDINGMSYTDLPDTMKDTFDSYMLEIHYFDNITEDEIKEMFFRLNNGKALSNVELTRARTLSLSEINELAKHPVFADALTVKAYNKMQGEDIIMKILSLLYSGNKCLEDKVVRPFLQTTKITEDNIKEVTAILDRMKESVDIIKENKTTAKIKICKKIYKKIHFISLAPIIKRSIDEGKTSVQMALWLENFFGSNEGTTISEKYNSTCRSKTNDAIAVSIRLGEIEDNYNTFDFVSAERLRPNR